VLELHADVSKIPTPEATLKAACDAAAREIDVTLKQKTTQALDAWVVAEPTFSKYVAQCRDATSQSCERIVKKNREAVADLLRQAAHKAVADIRRTSRVDLRLPVLPAALVTTMTTAVSRETHRFEKQYNQYSSAELAPFRKTISDESAAIQRKLEAENVQLWTAKIAPAKRCAVSQLKAEQFDAGFFSPYRYFSWLVERRRRSVVRECYAERNQGAVPDEVLEMIIEHWGEDPEFAAISAGVSSNLKVLLTLVIGGALFTAYILRRAGRHRASAEAAAAALRERRASYYQMGPGNVKPYSTR
jgi:hypothetical protein